MPPRPRRSLAPTLIALAALVACAHTGEGIVERGDDLPIHGVAVVVRYAPADAREAAQVRRVLDVAIPVAQRWGPLPVNLSVTIHATHDALESSAAAPGAWWVRAWSRRDRIDLQSPRTWTRGAASDADLAQLLAHELTHCVMFEAIGGDRPTELGVPAWFREGMATSNAGERFATPDRDALGSWTTNAAFRGESAPLAYAAANDAFLALERRYGQARIAEILRRVRAGARFPDAFQQALGISLAAFEADLLHVFVAQGPSTG